MGFDFAAYERAYEARKVEHEARLRAALAAGRTVLETYGKNVKAWHKGSGAFIEPADSDPAYLAEHIANRHFGFGWPNVIDGVRYRLGLIEAGPAEIALG